MKFDEYHTVFDPGSHCAGVTDLLARHTFEEGLEVCPRLLSQRLRQNLAMFGFNAAPMGGSSQLKRSNEFVVQMPSAANSSFIVVQPMGPISVWQRLNGTVFSAGTGMFNSSTGVFTRTGAATHQIGTYALDSAIMAAVRATPGALDIMFPQ